MTGEIVAGTLHVLYSLRAEGCPRLALSLLHEERRQHGRLGSVAVAVETPSDLAPEFQALGVPIAPLGWRPRGFIDLARRMSRLLAIMRPRAIICYTVGMHVSVAVAAHRHRVPNVLHIGNAPPRERRGRTMIGLQMQAGRPFVTGYAACSAYVRRAAVAAYGLPSSAVATIPNGIDLHTFDALRARRRMRPTQRPPVVGMVASFEGHKDQATLIDALALARHRGGDLRLRLIGSGAREADLRSLAAARGVSDSIDWTGVVHDVPAALAQLDVFAYSVTADEGLGIALVEAMASGLPILASDVGACREVLADGRHGTLIPERDASAWADAMLSLQSLAAPQPAAASRYDIARTLASYDRLLSGAPALRAVEGAA